MPVVYLCEHTVYWESPQAVSDFLFLLFDWSAMFSLQYPLQLLVYFAYFSYFGPVEHHPSEMRNMRWLPSFQSFAEFRNAIPPGFIAYLSIPTVLVDFPTSVRLSLHDRKAGYGIETRWKEFDFGHYLLEPHCVTVAGGRMCAEWRWGQVHNCYGRKRLKLPIRILRNPLRILYLRYSF